MSTYRFTGKVVDQSTRHGLAEARVEAWDAEEQSPDLVAHAVTDKLGTFHLVLDEAYVKEHFQDRSPAVAFRVFAEGARQNLVRYESSNFVWHLIAESTTGRIEVNMGRLSTTNTTPTGGLVRGTVRTSAGAPPDGARDLVVRVYDQRVTGETELAFGQPDDYGQYAIRYDFSATSGRPSPDISVGVFLGADTRAKSSIEHRDGQSRPSSNPMSRSGHLEQARRLLVAMRFFSLRALTVQSTRGRVLLIRPRRAWGSRPPGSCCRRCRASLSVG